MIAANGKRAGILLFGVILAFGGCATQSPPPPAPVSHAVMAQQETFATPEEGVDALVAATRANRKAELLKILGPQAANLIHSGDAVADRKGREKFLAAYDKAHSLQSEGENREVLVVGEEEWPMPIPLVRAGGGWQFDTAAGQQEILNRRIGRNELNVIQVARAYVEAQREFAAQHKLGDRKSEYAQHFVSTEGRHDGLYWPAAAGEKESPLGPLIAQAAEAGYSEAVPGKHVPYNGYFYRILLRQGSHAAGGAKNYIKDGHMTGGFAMIAWPARYGNSGVMSFIVNQNGIVYEKNFGSGTPKIAARMTQYDPDSGWNVVQ